MARKKREEVVEKKNNLNKFRVGIPWINEVNEFVIEADWWKEDGKGASFYKGQPGDFELEVAVFKDYIYVIKLSREKLERQEKIPLAKNWGKVDGKEF